MENLTIDRGFLYEDKKKVLVQIGINFFELHFWGELKGKNPEEHAKDLTQLLKDRRYSFQLIKEE